MKVNIGIYKRGEVIYNHKERIHKRINKQYVFWNINRKIFSTKRYWSYCQRCN